MTLWEDLLKTALLGTERQRPTAPAGGPAPAAVTAVLSRLPAGPPDDAVLAAAAVVSTCRRAGFVPPADPSVTSLPTSDPDDLPQASPRAAHHLSAMLRGERRDLLPEWAAAAAAAGRRAPDATLPQLLDFARARPDLRDVLRPVLGKRGRWLASLNPDWTFAAGPDPSADAGDTDSVWQTGERQTRLLLLTRLRHGDPARARALVRSTWDREPAEDRARFLAAFSGGLSPADEPFLEAALDDRGKEVRRAAAALLARLPDSRLVARMTERAAPLLAWKAGKKPKLGVTLPAAPDKAGERDGLEPKPQQGRVGQKQAWLWQILACVPPSTWSKQWRATPGEVVAALRKHEFENVLVAGWAQAAARHNDAAWAEALIVTEAATLLEFAGEAVGAELREALPKGRRDALLRELLAEDSTGRADDEPPALTLLRGADGPWSEKLSIAVIDRMRAMAGRAPDAAYWKTIQMLRDMSARVPPSMLGELARGWPEGARHWDRWKGGVDEFLSAVQFRKEMLEEIRR